MEAIQLIYAENVISRKKGIPQQELTFFLVVQNLSYNKQVEIRWAGEDGIWQTLSAQYHSGTTENREFWQARTKLQLSSGKSLPGNVQFALHYTVNGQEFWDSNEGNNFNIEADSGVCPRKDALIQNVKFRHILQQGQRFCSVSAVVHRSLNPQQVFIEWSTNGWQTTHKTPLVFSREHWDKNLSSNARNPNQYGYSIWSNRIKVGDEFRVEYALGCDTGTKTVWNNNFGKNFTARRDRLKVLALNLHCYQEDNQDYKLSLIARVIQELDIDVVCLQEVAENWNNGQGDWNSNAAKIIRDRLPRHYHVHTDWSHLGFDRYREGVAILSKYELHQQDAGYVSGSNDAYSIHSRKVVTAKINVPYVGWINVFSAHLSWWEDGFAEQFTNLKEWANQRHESKTTATLLCGDFNIKAGSEGYRLVVDSKDYEDQYLKATSRNQFDRVFRHDASDVSVELADDHRIDYLFMKRASRLQALSGRVLFTEEDYGRVSDHCGYYVEFEPA